MLSLPEGSQRTRSLWSGYQRHAIRIETVILVLSFLCMIFGIAEAARTHDSYFYAWNLPGPFVSCILSTGAIWAFTKRALHPIYSLSIATFMLLGWTATLFCVVWSNEWIVDAIESGDSGLNNYAPEGLYIVMDALYGIVTIMYIFYIGFAARAVDNNRKRKRQGILELDDGMGVELVKRGSDA